MGVIPSTSRALIQCAVLAGLAALIASTSAAAREKTDVVILKNGDRITGEIKQLDRGKLRVKTDYMGTVNIQWEDVHELTSEFHYDVEREDGARFYGSLQQAPNDQQIAVSGESTTTAVQHMEIVRLAPIEETFWRRLDGSMSVGFGLTQATDLAELFFDASASHRTRKYLRTLAFNTSVSQELSSQPEGEEATGTSRWDLSFTTQRFLRDKRFLPQTLLLQHREAQGLDLRILASGGVGRHLVQTNQNEIRTAAGVALTWENYASPDVADDFNVEVALGLGYQAFRFDDPEVDISMSLEVYPSITDLGRLRVELSSNVRRELAKDLFWNLSILESYDSRPPAGSENQEVDKNDLTLNASLGWSF